MRRRQNIRRKIMSSIETEPTTKNAVRSITVLGSLVVLVVTAGKLLGVDLSVLTEVQNEIIVIVGAVAAIIGRFRASTGIHLW
jgi:hypothetical protein